MLKINCDKRNKNINFNVNDLSWICEEKIILKILFGLESGFERLDLKGKFDCLD